MTKKCLFERSTGLFLRGTTRTDILHNSATHIQLTLTDYPNRRTRRWDGVTDTRAATPQELIDYDEDAEDIKAVQAIDGMKAPKALAAEALIEINVLRTNAGLATIAAVEWRQRLLNRYKAL